MSTARVIRINTDELIEMDIYDRLSKRPVIEGTVQVQLRNLDDSPVPGGTFTLSHIEHSPGTWRGIIPSDFTANLVKNKRYKLAIDIASGSGRYYAEVEVEAIIYRLE